ncbi:MAG: hypothetical protein EU544_01415 [Promethearchaeota archaeon]|nr:MAG: hypothetical protein EU544_01415 [Candidatus Lokiarchaeota archaeon]
MKAKILLEKPSNKLLGIIFITTLILMFVFLALFAPILGQFPPGAGLYDMKGAWTKENMDKIIRIWKEEDLDYYVELMLLVHFIDGFFMIDYGIAVFSGLLLVARLLSQKPKIQDFYFKLAFISWLATILDVVEQINILIMLSDPNNIQDVNVFTASLSTALCVIVLYSCIALMLIGFIIASISHVKSK